ncbi:MAG: hypothetical protein RR232_04575 [Clostridia bacterium]
MDILLRVIERTDRYGMQMRGWYKDESCWNCERIKKWPKCKAGANTSMKKPHTAADAYNTAYGR